MKPVVKVAVKRKAPKISISPPRKIFRESQEDESTFSLDDYESQRVENQSILKPEVSSSNQEDSELENSENDGELRREPPPDWTIETKPNIYWPQVGMQVLYSATSYIRWGKSHKQMFKAPHAICSSLNPTGKGVITSLSYTEEGIILHIDFTDAPSIITLFYPVPPAVPAFLVPLDLVRPVSNKLVGSPKYFERKGQKDVGMIKSVNSKDPFECLYVEFDYGSRKCSAWELREGVGPIVTQEQKAAVNFGKSMANLPKYLSFLNDCEDVAQIISKGMRPISYRIIKERAINKWYRTAAMIADDLLMLDKISKEIFHSKSFEMVMINLFKIIKKEFKNLKIPDVVNKMT